MAHPVGKGQNKARDTFYSGQPGRPANPVACALAEASSATLESGAKKGIFSCRPAEKLLGGWTGFPWAGGPFSRLLGNVVAADLRRATILVDKLPKLHPASHFDARPVQ